MEEIIEEFIEKTHYQDNKNILEIIFYGSTKYKTNDSSSDIDLLIITNRGVNLKGVAFIKNRKIEYHEKSILSLLQEIDSIEDGSDNSLFSIFYNGTPLLNKTSIFEDIIEELNNKSLSHKKKKRRSEVKDFYERYKASTSNIKSFFYHNTLEEIRKKYQEENGYSKVQPRKVKLLYSNREYARAYYCINIPDEDFTNNYLEALNESEDKLNNLYSKLTYKEGFDNPQYGNSSKTQIIFYSTHINSELEKLEIFYRTDKSYYIHLYYIILEKIRKLYANKVRIDTRIICFPEAYEDSFLALFYECINKKSLEGIYKLFRYVVDDYNIDYKNYKVLEY